MFCKFFFFLIKRSYIHWVCLTKHNSDSVCADWTKTKNTEAVTTNIRPVNAFWRHTYIRLVYIDEYFI